MKKILLVLAVSLSFNALVSCKKNNKTSSSLSSSISSIQHTSSSIISSSESSSNIVVSSDTNISANTSSSTSSTISTSSSSSTSPILEPVDINSYYEGYYSSLSSWENGNDLKEQLKNIISRNVIYTPYSSTWSVLQKADQSQTNFDKVETVYSSLEQLKSDTYSSSNTKGWQKEHAFCQSLMGHYVNTTTTQLKLDETYKIDNVKIVNNGFVVTYTSGMVSDDVYSLAFTYLDKNAVIIISNDKVSIYESSNTKTPLSSVEPLFTMDVAAFSSIYARENNLVLVNKEEEQILLNPTHVTYKFKGEGGSGGTSSDWHNLFASNNSGNGSRGNKNLGVVASPTSTSLDYKYDTKVFEPSDEDKGQLARGILYMDTMYEDLLLEEEYVELSKVLASDIGRHGNSSSIIDWALSFDVDEHEYQHNDVVYGIQYNRNPYIDFPALVDFVYGSKKDEPGSVEDIIATSTQDKLSTDEAIYKNIALEGVQYTYEIGDSFSISDIDHIYTTYTDFSYIEVEDRSKIISNVEENYEFNQIGTFDITLSDGTTNVTYQIDVVDKYPTLDCDVSFSSYVDGKNVGKTKFSGLTSSNPLTNVDLGGIYYNASINAGKMGTSSSSKGVAFGSTTAPVATLTLETMETVERTISKIYINASMSSSKTALLSIYIGDKLVGNATLDSSPHLYEFENISSYEGKLKIEFTSVNGTLYLMQIAFKYK
ncbi:MAG: endonuclease [Bacilli bacterium]